MYQHCLNGECYLESKGVFYHPPPTTLMFVGLQCPSSRSSTSDSQEVLIRKEFSRTSTKDLLRSIYNSAEGLKYSKSISWLLPFGTQFNQMHLNSGHFAAIQWELVDQMYNNDERIDFLFWSVNLVNILLVHPHHINPIAFQIFKLLMPNPRTFQLLLITSAVYKIQMLTGWLVHPMVLCPTIPMLFLQR